MANLILCIRPYTDDCVGQFDTILNYLLFPEKDPIVCRDPMETPNVFIYDMGLQWAPLLLFPVVFACVVLILVTLPCQCRLKKFLDRIVSKLDLDPDLTLHKINDDEYRLNGSDTEEQRRIIPKRKRTVIGGWMALVVLVIVIATISFLVLNYLDKRSVTLQPFMASSLSHSAYKVIPQQVQLNFQVLIGGCTADLNSNCTNLFNLRSLNSFNFMDLNCTVLRERQQCILAWNTTVVSLYSLVLENLFSRSMNFTFAFDNNEGYYVIAVLVSSRIWADSNFHGNQEEMHGVLKWVYNQMQSSRGSYIYSSFRQCMSYPPPPYPPSDIALKGLYRRIHYWPFSWTTDRSSNKELFSQGVSFLELVYPQPVRENPRWTTVFVEIETEQMSWVFSSPSLVHLLIQIAGVLGASLVVPQVVKSWIQVLLSKVSSKGAGPYMKVLAVMFPFFGLIATTCILTIVQPQYSSTELVNIIWIFLVLFCTLCLILVLRLFWEACCNKK